MSHNGQMRPYSTGKPKSLVLQYLSEGHLDVHCGETACRYTVNCNITSDHLDHNISNRPYVYSLLDRHLQVWSKISN